jgi:hypothetical protein
VEVGPMRWEYPVVAIEPDGIRAWEHRLPARASHVTPAPGGQLIVTASPSRKRWNDYHQWCDLSAETFVRSVGPDGAERWTWYAPGPVTHLPVVSPSGTVYVGCDKRLWALPTAATAAGTG